MVAYSFKGRFEAPLRDGLKRTTIRKVGKKRHARPGERMTFTTADRFHPRLIGEARCADVQAITINFERTTPGGRRLHAHIIIGTAEAREVIRTPLLDAFARRDGFADWADMVAFWRETHGPIESFEGLCIRWTDFKPVAP